MNSDFNASLLQFLDNSPTPFHAVSSLVERFVAAGFTRLEDGESWSLQKGDELFRDAQ